MKRVAFVGALTLATVSVGMVQERTHPQKSPQMTARGQIVSLDASAKTITVSMPSEHTAAGPEARSITAEMIFTIKDETKITAHGPDHRELGFDDLQEGDWVVVKYVDAAKSKLAKSIQVPKSNRE